MQQSTILDKIEKRKIVHVEDPKLTSKFWEYSFIVDVVVKPFFLGEKGEPYEKYSKINQSFKEVLVLVDVQSFKI